MHNSNPYGTNCKYTRIYALKLVHLLLSSILVLMLGPKCLKINQRFMWKHLWQKQRKRTTCMLYYFWHAEQLMKPAYKSHKNSTLCCLRLERQRWYTHVWRTESANAQKTKVKWPDNFKIYIYE